MAGSSFPGSRITCCQLAARSQAKSSTRVVPCQAELVGLRSACGARERRSSIEKSSIPVTRAPARASRWGAVGEHGGEDKQLWRYPADGEGCRRAPRHPPKTDRKSHV